MKNNFRHNAEATQGCKPLGPPSCSASFNPSSLEMVAVSNESGQIRHIHLSDLDNMSQYLLKKNPRGIAFRLKYGILILSSLFVEKISSLVRDLRFQKERYSEWKKSYLYLVGDKIGSLTQERVKFLSNAQVDTRDSSRCVSRLVRLVGFLFGVCCWVGFPFVLLGLPTFFIFGMGGGDWFAWTFYVLSWVVAFVWWFLCFRWSPTREFIETYTNGPSDRKTAKLNQEQGGKAEVGASRQKYSLFSLLQSLGGSLKSKNRQV